MEAQMPKQIMGMGYQQRFQVRRIFAKICRQERLDVLLHSHLSIFSRSLGILRIAFCFSAFLPSGLHNRSLNDSSASTQVCTFFHNGIVDLYGFVRYLERTDGTPAEHVSNGSNLLHLYLSSFHVYDALLHIFLRRSLRLYLGHWVLLGTNGGPTLVFD
jgi:hypothetical protein